MSQSNNPPPGEPSSRKKTPAPAPSQWRSIIVYLPLLLLVLYLWQEYVMPSAVQTIPYSAFQKCVALSVVKKCDIHESEISGEMRVPHDLWPKVKAILEQGEAEANSAAGETAKTVPATDPAHGQPTGSQSTTSPPAKAQPAEGESTKPSAASAKPEADAQSAKAGGELKVIPFRTIRIDDLKLVDDLRQGGGVYEGVRPSLLSSFLIAWIAPLALIAFFWFFLARRIGSAGQAVMSIGKSRARLVADQETGVTFADVAGCDEAKYELQEVVDFLKNPRRYEALGAKIPKGILLVGPPGTGKTLMARAVAGEAHVPFFSISGSDFVEMFVGVGAARVRDLFETAKKQAPCIIFIDELDAIGRQRGIHVTSTNDEREQTLNQLLVGMDGFEPNLGVIILAATNRPDVLDRALLRPGRFDRQVVVDAPDVDGREAILKVHSRGKRLGEDVNLRKIAQATVGFSGADLANTLNEAALLAARRNHEQIVQKDLEEAVEKLVAGPERTSRRLDAEEKRRVAIHEVGHAVVAAYSKYADPVHKISIVPRGRAALGYTLQLPTAEQFLLTRSALLDRLKGLLGGRAAEEVVFDEVSTGAENDLERATAMARQMVCMFGMSESVGLAHYVNRQAEFLGSLPDMTAPKECSEATFTQIDAEVKKLLDQAYKDAKAILREHHDQLDGIVKELLERESLDAAAFNRLLGRSGDSNGEPQGPPVPPQPRDHAPTI